MVLKEKNIQTEANPTARESGTLDCGQGVHDKNILEYK